MSAPTKSAAVIWLEAAAAAGEVRSAVADLRRMAERQLRTAVDAEAALRLAAAGDACRGMLAPMRWLAQACALEAACWGASPDAIGWALGIHLPNSDPAAKYLPSPFARPQAPSYTMPSVATICLGTLALVAWAAEGHGDPRARAWREQHQHWRHLVKPKPDPAAAARIWMGEPEPERPTLSRAETDKLYADAAAAVAGLGGLGTVGHITMDTAKSVVAAAADFIEPEPEPEPVSPFAFMQRDYASAMKSYVSSLENAGGITEPKPKPKKKKKGGKGGKAKKAQPKPDDSADTSDANREPQ